MSAEQARGYLAGVNAEHAFWLNDGGSLHSLEDLRNALRKMDAGTFQHHVNKERNDFSNWISDVVNDKQLASSIRRVKAKKTVYSKVSKRVSQLKRTAKK